MNLTGKIPEEKNVLITIFLFIITAGIYTLIWIYLKNLEFESIFKIDLDHRRSFIILFVLPSITSLICYLIYLSLPTVIALIPIFIISTFIFLIILKYLFEFSIHGATLTQSPLALWFIPFSITFTGIILILLGIPYVGIPLLLLEAFHIATLQSQLNMTYKVIRLKKQRKKSIH